MKAAGIHLPELPASLTCYNHPNHPRSEWTAKQIAHHDRRNVSATTSASAITSDTTLDINDTHTSDYDTIEPFLGLGLAQRIRGGMEGDCRIQDTHPWETPPHREAMQESPSAKPTPGLTPYCTRESYAGPQPVIPFRVISCILYLQCLSSHRTTGAKIVPASHYLHSPKTTRIHTSSQCRPLGHSHWRLRLIILKKKEEKRGGCGVVSSSLVIGMAPASSA